MADRKDCAHYADCSYRNDIGICPYWCMKYKHRDEVRIVRCKDCKHWIHLEDGMGDCTNRRFHIPGVADICMNAEEFCCLGERKDNG